MRLVDNPFLSLKARSLLVWSLLILLFLGLGLGLLGAIVSLDSANPIWEPSMYILFFSLLCCWVLRRFRRLRANFGRVVGRLPQDQRWLPIGGLVIALWLFSMSAFLLSFHLMSLINPTFVETLLKKESFLSTSETSTPGLYNLLTVVATVVVAPVTEEIIFRGILLQRWAIKWGIRASLLASSLVFGVLHVDMVGAFMFGLVMGLLYIKTRTLFVPMTCHTLNNSLALALTFLPVENNATDIYTLEQLQADWWWGILLLILSFPWLARFIYRNYPKKNSQIPYFVNRFR